MLKPNPAIDARPTDSRLSERSCADLAHRQDQELLALYLRTRDAQAFGAIVARHGAMVFRTCFRLVNNSHDAEDAAQAVFLVLSRFPSKATGSLTGWLYKVARDTAITLLRSRARRARNEEAAAMQKSTTSPPASPVRRSELRHELDHAIAALPTRLREAVVVCHLEGRRQEEAARMLGCNQGTLSRRVADGLDRLRSVLVRRGVMVTPAVLIAFLAEQHAQAALPATLLGSLQGTAAGGPVSSQAMALADATVRAGTMAKLKIAAGVLLTTLVIGVATFALWPASDRFVLVNFDGTSLPVNQAGNPYPRNLDNGDLGNGGPANLSLNAEQAVAGNCLNIELLAGRLKIEFDPDGIKHHTFAREQGTGRGWRFNTYNRLRFWIKTPASSLPLKTNGDVNMNVGIYARRVRNANLSSLDDGGGTFNHLLNVPAADAWTQVVLNAHPHMVQSKSVISDLLHPTGEADFNYFDAMTRIYIEVKGPPARYPANYALDEVEFVRESNTENDAQVFSITATHIAAENRLILTWNRPAEEDTIRHEVRYAFRSIHEIGWDRAEPAPNGIVLPPGKQARTSMVYDATSLPLSGQSIIYLAIKPENAKLFSQIAVPLTLR